MLKNTITIFAALFFFMSAGLQAQFNCEPPRASVTELTCSSAVVQWAAQDSFFYQVTYSIAGTGRWMEANQISWDEATLRLQPSTTYIVKVSYDCFGRPVVKEMRIRTPRCGNTDGGSNTCAPIRPVIESVTCETAVIAWENNPAIQSYEIRYYNANANAPNVILTSTSPATLRIEPNTTYKVEIVYTCNGVRKSADLSFTSPECPGTNQCNPIHLTATTVNCSTAVFAWRPPMNMPIEVFYINTRKDGSTSGSTDKVPGNTYTFTKTGLEGNSTYIVSVSYVCNGREYNERVVITTPKCDSNGCEPAKIVVDSVTCEYAMAYLQNVNPNTRFMFQYREANANQWITIQNQNNPVFMGNLKPNTTYLILVTVICPNGNTVTSEQKFTTPDCPGTGCETAIIKTDGITCNSAKVFLSNINSNDRFLVQYRPSNSTQWMTIQQQSNPISLNNLQPNTTYYIKVTVICSNGTTTVAEAKFTTPNCPDPNCKEILLDTSNITCRSVILKWNAVSSTQMYSILVRKDGSNIAYDDTTSGGIYTAQLEPESTYIITVSYTCNGRLYTAKVVVKTPACPSGGRSSGSGSGINQNWQVFPNPNQGMVYIAGTGDQMAAFSVKDMTGRRLLDGEVSGTEKRPIDLTNFGKGMYIITVTEGSESKSFMVEVQ